MPVMCKLNQPGQRRLRATYPSVLAANATLPSTNRYALSAQRITAIPVAVANTIAKPQ